ncbi:hypothetical protein B0H12DRAFT_1066541 [Mycena haematopus]|nr:hypothetical protein B0H12DRAFT_1066541 [Mycena haematopus]
MSSKQPSAMLTSSAVTSPLWNVGRCPGLRVTVAYFEGTDIIVAGGDTEESEEYPEEASEECASAFAVLGGEEDAGGELGELGGEVVLSDVNGDKGGVDSLTVLCSLAALRVVRGTGTEGSRREDSLGELEGLAKYRKVAGGSTGIEMPAYGVNRVDGGKSLSEMGDLLIADRGGRKVVGIVKKVEAHLEFYGKAESYDGEGKEEEVTSVTVTLPCGLSSTELTGSHRHSREGFRLCSSNFVVAFVVNHQNLPGVRLVVEAI